MKRLLFISIILFLACGCFAQKDSTFKDVRDGKTYKTVKIGKQVWMSENLAFKIDHGYWSYKNDTSKIPKYGYYYNWETAKNVCPTGWRLPTKYDFKILLKNVSDSVYDAFSPQKLGTNSGFSVLFSGSCFKGSFSDIGKNACFWSSSPSNEESAWYMFIINNTLKTGIDYNIHSLSFSVRCLQASSFSHETGILFDARNGKTYKTVKIGNQLWMAENLAFKTKKGSWAYNNNESNVAEYGYLYNWKTARSSCPDGWHLPSDKEWKQMEIYLGMSKIDANNTTDYRGTVGNDLKGTEGWLYSGNGDNSSGFNALSGGYRNNYGSFEQIGMYACFWSSSHDRSSSALFRALYYDEVEVSRSYCLKADGYSVRCIKNN